MDFMAVIGAAGLLFLVIYAIILLEFVDERKAKKRCKKP